MGALVPLASGIALAACGGDSSAPASPSAKPATLVVNTDWIGANPRGQVTDAAVAEYKLRYPQVTVKIEPFSGGNGDAALLTSLIASDSIGDVSLWTHQLVVYFAKRNFFTDLRPYLKTFKFSMDDVYYIKEICYYEDKLLAVPFQLNLFDYLYNKTLFKQAGVAPPSDNWTVEQMISTAKQLTNVDKKIYGLDMDIGTGSPNMWATPIRASGGTLLNSTFTKTTLADQVAVETLQLMIDVIQKHQAAPTRQARSDLKLSFGGGNFAMAPLTGGASRSLTKQMAEAGGMEWDFFPSPIWPRTNKRATQANLQPYIVPATKRPSLDEAVRLAFFMGGEFVQGVVADLGNTAPTFKKLIDSDRYLPATHRRKVSLDGHAYRWGMGSNFEHYTPWRNAVQTEIFKGWDGQLSPKATGEAATAAGDAALAANGVKVG